MRRLAFLAAASLAFIAISDSPSAEARSENRRCRDACYKEQKYREMSDEDKKKWSKCIDKCDKDVRKRDFKDCRIGCPSHN